MRSTQTTLFISAIAAAAIAISIAYIFSLTTTTAANTANPLPTKQDSTPPSPLCHTLHTALPNTTFFPSSPTYKSTQSSYWSLLPRQNIPACILLPTSALDVSAAISLLKSAYDTDPSSVKFAVRSGGHSPEADFANIDSGVLIDLSRLNAVSVSDDRETVQIGVGAKWGQVSSILDRMGLGIVGGRNANVGVGGLVLGGGVSFFSPRFGMVCDNVVGYEVVFADGEVGWVEEEGQRGDLWRALKGGGGNFGIVTRIKARTFVVGNVWAGYAFWGAWQAEKVLRAFYESNEPERFDEFAAGPILALSYVQKVGVRAVASSLVYTKPEKWPAAFQGFNKIWRLWSTTKIQSVTAATKELDSLAQTGQRQFQVTTTVRNDLETFLEFNKIYSKGLERVKGVKGGVWSLVLQPLSAAVTKKGSPNVMGLGTRHSNETLVIVLVSIAWQHARDDDLVFRVSRDIIDECEEFAHRTGTADAYKYLNYAASGQNVFEGYGEANKKFMLDVSRKYDPDGFFQKAKRGGFHLEADSI